MTSRTSSSKRRFRSTRSADNADVWAPRNVLVVEDDPAVQGLLERALLASGYSVQVASDGVQALQRLEEGTPDLVIVDIMIPRLDGVALVKALREHEKTSRVPVMFLTARSDAQSMIAGIDVGARYYVTKPFRIEDVLAKVDRALNRIAGLILAVDFFGLLFTRL